MAKGRLTVNWPLVFTLIQIDRRCVLHTHAIYRTTNHCRMCLTPAGITLWRIDAAHRPFNCSQAFTSLRGRDWAAARISIHAVEIIAMSALSGFSFSSCNHSPTTPCKADCVPYKCSIAVNSHARATAARKDAIQLVTIGSP